MHNLFLLKSFQSSVSGILLISGVVISCGLQAPANAFSTVPCPIDPLNPSDPLNSHKICGVRGAVYKGKIYNIDLFSGLAKDLYGVNGENLTVTSQAQAEHLMAASAEALNAFAITKPFNPNRPPVLFGNFGAIDFKLAFNLIKGDLNIRGDEFWDASHTRWEPLPVGWRIAPVVAQFPADVPAVWADVQEVPGPLPLLGVGAAFSYSRKLRKRINSSKLR